MTDTQRILALFRNSGGRWISNGEIIKGDFYGKKPIIEYSGRITNARDSFDPKCTCGKDQETCKAVEHIVNVKKNYFQYTTDINKRAAKINAPEEPRDFAADMKKYERMDQELKKLKDVNREETQDARILAMRKKLYERGLGKYKKVAEELF